MGIMVHSLLWVMQDLYHEPYLSGLKAISLSGSRGDLSGIHGDPLQQTLKGFT